MQEVAGDSPYKLHWSVTGFLLTVGETGKHDLVKCSGKRMNSFHKQLINLCQEVRRVDEMRKREGNSTAEFREDRIHKKEEKMGTRATQRCSMQQ